MTADGSPAHNCGCHGDEVMTAVAAAVPHMTASGSPACNYSGHSGRSSSALHDIQWPAGHLLTWSVSVLLSLLELASLTRCNNV